MNLKNIDGFLNNLKTNFNRRPNIVTSDCGIEETVDLEFYQKLEFATLYNVAVMKWLKYDGVKSCCVCKHFLPYIVNIKESQEASGFFMNMIYLYSLMFNKLHLVKPVSLRVHLIVT